MLSPVKPDIGNSSQTQSTRCLSQRLHIAGKAFDNPEVLMLSNRTLTTVEFIQNLMCRLVVERGFDVELIAILVVDTQSQSNWALLIICRGIIQLSNLGG